MTDDDKAAMTPGDREEAAHPPACKDCMNYCHISAGWDSLCLRVIGQKFDPVDGIVPVTVRGSCRNERRRKWFSASCGPEGQFFSHRPREHPLTCPKFPF